MGQETAYIGIRCSKKMDEMIERIADHEGIQKSKLIRDLLQAGLIAKGYVDGEATMQEQIQAAVQTAMQPHVERLAAISAKAAHISAAAFFLTYADIRGQMPPEMIDELDEVAAQARKLGVEYLKLSKNKDVDQFIRSGLDRMSSK